MDTAARGITYGNSLVCYPILIQRHTTPNSLIHQRDNNLIKNDIIELVKYVTT